MMWSWVMLLAQERVLIKFLCFKIQNMPDEHNSSPRTVFPVLLCTTLDAKQHGYRKVLEPLIEDLKRLEQGIDVYYGNDLFLLKAVVTIFCGDTLAVHDIFGLLGPSANYFCRMCQVSRQEFHRDPFTEHPLRDRAWYEYNIEAVQNGYISPKDCGLKSSGCILNKLMHYHITDNFALDGMHDLAEGVIPLTIQLVLSHYCKQKEVKINVEYINNRINTFTYGFSDRKNKPSANFTNEMITDPTKHKMRQTAAQALLLLRSFPFLFGHLVSEDCQYMHMIGHLINIVRIIWSPVVSQHLLCQLDEHIMYFEQTFYDNFNRKINKLHHLQHYSTCILKSGAMKQYNCLQFEQANKVGKNQAATCRNFINICFSLAKRQCFKMIVNLLDNPFCDKLVYKSGRFVKRTECLSDTYLDQNTEFVFVPNTATLNGIEFRKNSVISLRIHENDVFPTYGIIREIVVVSSKVMFLLRMCYTTWYDDFLEAYVINQTDKDKLIHMEECFTHTTFSFWSPYGSMQKYISRRFYNQDY